MSRLKKLDIFRSVLYMPGSNERALEKAKGLDCDALIFDLEDAVAPDKKDLARQIVKEYIVSHKYDYGRKRLLVRVNSWDSPWGYKDFREVATMIPDGILLPKINRASDFKKYFEMLDNPLDPGVKIWAMIETASAVINMVDIASCLKNLRGLVLGTNDLAMDLNIIIDRFRYPLLASLSMANTVAKAHKIICLDGVYNAFKDTDGLKQECEQGKSFGFDGKTLIHPSQIQVTNEVFSPTDEDVRNANMQMEAYMKARSSGSGVAVLNGKIVENLHVEMAKNILEKAKIIKDSVS